MPNAEGGHPDRRPTAEDLERFQQIAVELFGGSAGVRDPGLLESAAARPWGEFFGRQRFPTAEEKAAALAEAVVSFHPFVDANKRTAMYGAGFLLRRHGLEVVARRGELEDFAVSIAEEHPDAAGISGWFREHTRPVE